jgi:outer membrane protein assembly factor BamB
MKRFGIRTVMALPLIFFLLFGCEKKKEKEETIEAVEEEPQAEEAEEASVLLEGYITYLSGIVSINRGAQWEPCDIDDFVGVEDRIKTEVESSCEVQFTDIGIIRIQESSEIVMRQIYLKEQKNSVDVNLVNGDLLCKVSKLSKGETFQVATDTTLAGVRGTEFMVQVQKGKKTKVAVSTGEVSVVPAPVAQKIEEIKKELQTETARQTLEEIALPEIVVTEGKEVTIEAEQSQKATREFEEISPVIEKNIKEIDKKAIAVEEKQEEAEHLPERKAQKKLEEIQEIEKDIEALKDEMVTGASEKAAAVNKEILSKPEAASEEAQENFREIERIKPKEAPMVIAGKETEEEKIVYTKLTIKVEPKNATIFVNGEERGKGMIKELYEPGTVLTIRAELDGYITATRNVTVLEEKVQDVLIRLDRFKQPVSWKNSVNNRRFIRAVVTSGGKITAADESGRVFGFSEEGKKLWEVPTENTPNENSIPVVAGNRVYFSGEKELLVIDIRNGGVLASVQVGKGALSSHLFGRRVAIYKDSLIYPSNDSLIFLDERNLREKNTIPVQGSSNSSPALWKGKIVLMNQNGELLIIDPETGKIAHMIETGALQPVSLAPTFWEDACAFAGRKGTVVAVDLKKQRVMWERKIDSGVFQDITIGKEGLYPFTGDIFYALSLKNGQRLFNPVQSTCSPLYYDGKLYFGDSRKRFVVADASTGKILTRYQLDGLITAMPAAISKTFVVTTDRGTLYGLNPEDM